jgi:hypothetical protein
VAGCLIQDRMFFVKFCITTRLLSCLSLAEIVHFARKKIGEVRKNTNYLQKRQQI